MANMNSGIGFLTRIEIESCRLNVISFPEGLQEDKYNKPKKQKYFTTE